MPQPSRRGDRKALSGHRCPISTNKSRPGGSGFSQRSPRSRCISAARRWRSRICRPTRPTTLSARRRSRSASNWPRRSARRPTCRPGPDTDASRRRPQLAEQKAEVKETDLPKDTPTETDDPDRVVTRERVEEAEGRRSEDRGGADAGLDRVGCRRSDRDAEFGGHPGRAAFGRAAASAPARARAACARPGRRNWSPISTSTSAIRRSARRRPPRSSSASCSTGWAMCSRPASKRVRAIPAFDEAALAMVRRSDPVPAPPPLIADEGLSFTLPVIFRVKGKS